MHMDHVLKDLRLDRLDLLHVLLQLDLEFVSSLLIGRHTPRYIRMPFASRCRSHPNTSRWRSHRDAELVRLELAQVALIVSHFLRGNYEAIEEAAPILGLRCGPLHSVRDGS